MLRLTALLLLALAAPQAPGNTALIVGRVLDQSDGRPIPGAVVEIMSDAVANRVVAATANPVRRQLTDASGRFVFREMPGGVYSVRVMTGGTGFSPNGFIQSGFGFPISSYLEGGYGQRRPGGPTQPLVLAEGQSVPDLVIRLWKGAAINGVVTDDLGEPVVDTVVGAVQVSTDGTLLTGPTTHTDDRGMYRLSALAPGRYILFVPQTTTAMSAESAENLMQRYIALQEAKTPGATVAPAAELSGFRVGDSLVKTSPAGYVDGNIMPRRDGAAIFVYQTTFRPNATALGGAAPIDVDAGDDRTGVDISLQPVRAVPVSGTVATPRGPAGGIQLRLVPGGASADAALFDVALTTSDALGRFAFPLVPVGNYTLLGMSTGSSVADAVWLSAPVSVGPDGAKDLAFAMKPDLTVSGRYEFIGSSPAPTRAQLAKLVVGAQSVRRRARANPAGDMATALSTGDGSFSSAGIVPGRYIVSPMPLDAGSPWRVQSIMVGGREANDLPVDISEDLPDVRIVFTDKPAAVTGRVTSADPGDAAAAVLLFPADRSLWADARAMTRRFRLARTSVLGEFAIGDVPPGDYLIVAVPDLRTAAWPDAMFLAKLLPDASPLRIEPGQQPALSLTTREIR